MFFLHSVKGFDVNKIAACTLVFEGTREEVDRQKKAVFHICSKYNGLVAGPENGRKGYLLTFAIAYIRDFGNDYAYISESFETAVPWANVSMLCAKVKATMLESCRQAKVKEDRLFISFRVT